MGKFYGTWPELREMSFRKSARNLEEYQKMRQRRALSYPGLVFHAAALPRAANAVSLWAQGSDSLF
jgi:hypothetical protein